MEQFTNVDLVLQCHFYLPASERWLVDSKAYWPRLLFYNGPKIALIVFGAWLLITAFVRKPNWRPPSLRPLGALCFFTVSMICIPVLVASLKSATHVRCPYELREFGGEFDYVRLYEACCYGTGGRCFPAGHASGGFALMCLRFVGQRPGSRWLGFLAGLGLGWSMALYQMLKGAHFLSHSLTTMFLAWLVLLALSRVPLFKLPAPINSNTPRSGH